MTKKTRLIVLLSCVVCFLVVAPVLVLYSMGYRFDFEKIKITAIGGIYINTNPKAEEFIIDNKIIKKPGMLSNDISFLNLLPKNHTVLVKKTDYYDYSKTLPVEENQVTKLENILLFKKNIQFDAITDQTKSPFTKLDKFIIKDNNLYYSASPENSAILATVKAIAVFKGLVAFSVVDNNILYLGIDGFLYKADLTNLTVPPIKISTTAIKIIKTGSYKIIANSKNVFINSNGSLLIFNYITRSLDTFYSAVKDAKISPDGSSIIFYTNSNIYISTLNTTPSKITSLYKSSDKVTGCIWLNSSYIIFNAGDKVIFSEIDYRGNINTITLSQPANNSKIYFDQQLGKLYILTDKALMISEKLVP